MDLDKKIGIKENLIAEVGEQEGEMIWDRAKIILKEIEARYPNLPKGQQMHTGYIFPSAAVQLAVREIKGDQDLGYKVISEYSWAKSREMGARLRKTAKIPGFKRLFVKMWGSISIRKSIMIVQKTTVFPASRENVFEKIQKLETLQYIARPFATFYSWVFQWGGKVRIEGPEDAVTEYKEIARKALEG